jgi:hypothetical protein
VTDAQIKDQVAALNNTYAAGEGGATTGFSFRLAGVTRTDNSLWFYANPGGTGEHSMKLALKQGGDDALNYYSTTAGDYLGWSYLPDITAKPGQTYLDGVVVGWESMRGASTTYAGRYDPGETATHEVGHWLNLEHTFYGGCSAKGRLHRGHAGGEDRDVGLPRGQGHLPCPRPGPDPQLHGLLLRLLLHGVHRGPGAAHARRLAAVPRELSRAAAAPVERGRRGLPVRAEVALLCAASAVSATSHAVLIQLNAVVVGVSGVLFAVAGWAVVRDSRRKRALAAAT